MRRDTLERIERHIENLGDPDVEVACRAEACLIRYYRTRALDLLLKACKHRNAQVRWRAGWVLGETRDPRAYTTLLHLTRDPDGVVRYESAIALGMLGDARAARPLAALMAKRDEKTCVDDAAADGLCRLGRPALPAVLPVLKSRKADTRMLAAGVLGRVGGQTVIRALATLLTDKDPWVRVSAIEGLAQIGTARCLELIERGLNDRAKRVRESAAYWCRDVAKVLRAAQRRAARARPVSIPAR